MSRVMVVDDEPKILRLIGDMLSEAGHMVERCGDGDQARKMLGSGLFDLMISDVRLPGASGVDLLELARQAYPGIQVILITAYGTVSEGVEAMKQGAFDYIQKPFEMDALRLLVERALGETALREQLQVLRADDRRRRGTRELVGVSPAMGEVRRLILAVAATPSTVLLSGQSGTGKELVAEAVHRESGAVGQLVRVNCLAIPAELMESELFGHVKGAFTGASESRKGLFELADRGTLFLDEVADLPLELQGKLLRALEEQRISRVGSGQEIAVNARVIAATNTDLKARVDQGRFRGDLYYRLNVFPIELPTLQERTEDIPGLADCLLDEIAIRLGRVRPSLTDEALAVLSVYGWPGNVRELRNVLERGAVLALDCPLGVEHLPAELLAPPDPIDVASGSFNDLVDIYKQRLLLEALKSSGWVKKEAAERLGLSPRAMSHYISRFQLDRHRAGNSESD